VEERYQKEINEIYSSLSEEERHESSRVDHRGR